MKSKYEEYSNMSELKLEVINNPIVMNILSVESSERRLKELEVNGGDEEQVRELFKHVRPEIEIR